MKVVFDLGGVFYRWTPDRFVMHLVPKRAATPDAAAAFARDFFQSFDGDWSEFDRGTLEPEALARRTAQRLDLDVEDARRVIGAVPAELQPIEPTVALAERLRRAGRTLHFLSNMPRPYAQALTGRDRLFGLFESGVFSCHVGLIKPEAALFAHAADVFRAHPGDLVLVDDLERNVVAARRAGWHAVLFRDAAGCADDLAALGIHPEP